MKILEQLPENLQQHKIAWIIRHAERDGQRDKLTPNGISQAVELGKLLSDFPINAIYSSPTDRCVETSKLIVSQFSRDIPIILDYHLNEEGAYVTDMQKAIETYQKLGPEKFFKLLFTDHKLEGYNVYSQAAKNILQFVKSNTIEPGITLFITHQFIIRMLNHYLRKLTYKEKVMKVEFLKGIIVDVEN